MKKQSLIKGTVILGAAGVFARFLGLFFRWPVIMLIGDEGMGYYQMSYPLYMVFVGIAAGMPVAISKMISERSAVHDEEGIFQVVRTGLMLMLLLGGGTSIVFVLFARTIVEGLGWDPKAYYSMIGIGLAPFFIGIMSVFRGFFQGMQNMTPTAISQLYEQTGRVIVGVILVFMLQPRGIDVAAGGAAFGAVAGAVFGVTYLISKYIRVRKNFVIRRHGQNEGVLGELLHIAVPISLGAVVGTVMTFIDSVLVPQKLLQAGFTSQQATILYGQLTGKAFVLINVPLTMSIALGASLVPIIAEAHILRRKMEVINKVETAVKVSIVVGVPAMFGLFFMSAPILNMLFPGHSAGYQILKYASLTLPFIILTQTSTAILQGSGHYFTPIYNLVIGCIVKVFMTYLLVPIPYINIYGAVAGSLAAYIVTTALNMVAMSRKLNVSINYYETTIKPAYSAIVMIFGVVFIYQYVYNYTGSNGTSCLFSIFIGIVIYSLMIVITGVFEYSYIKKKVLKR
jgi:stage V sporulation protein B